MSKIFDRVGKEINAQSLQHSEDKVSVTIKLQKLYFMMSLNTICQGILHCQNIAQFHDTHVNVISPNVTPKAQPSLRRPS